MTRDDASAAVCVDVGSTWTKAVLVRSDGALAGFAEHPTTVADVLTGVDAAVRAVVAAAPGAAEPELLACSSAGGGLRLAVVGSERLATEEAAHRVARSAGSRVVHVHAGPLRSLGRADAAGQPAGRGAAARAARTATTPHRCCTTPPGSRAPASGSRSCSPATRRPATTRVALLTATGRTVVACPNVAPRPGELVPGPARAALAQLYADHVLGGRGPSVAPRFRRMVRVGTPDVVAGGAVLLARMLGVRVLVVDVGCATTDVHCALPDDGSRLTVEGDLGMRAAAAGVLVEGQAEGVVDPVEADLLGPTVERMTSEVGYVPRDPGSAAEDRRIAALAAVLAVRRHVVAHESDVPGDIGLLVLTGGVFRRPDGHALAAVVATLRADVELAALLAKARVAVDADFAVAPAGMLAAAGHAEAARTLLQDHLLG